MPTFAFAADIVYGFSERLERFTTLFGVGHAILDAFKAENFQKSLANILYIRSGLTLAIRIEIIIVLETSKTT